MVTVKIGGDYACFSRPEFKVERVSYPVITPSAARGVLEAIFWKPEIRYEIRKIGVLRPIRYTALLRNELDQRQGAQPLFIEEHRQQRATLFLRDVVYVIQAEVRLAAHASEPLPKYLDQFRRKVERGQCHHRPCLGTRECAAWFEPATADDTPLDLDVDLGRMLADLAYCEDEPAAELEFRRHDGSGARVATGRAAPLFFPARLERGWLHVPQALYQELSRMEMGDAR